MAVLPFGMWDVGNSFYEAVDLEDEEEDQYEEESLEKRTVFNVNCDDPESLFGDVLVISTGTAATTFIEMYIDLPPNHIGEMVELNTEENTQSKNVKNQSSLLYKVDRKIICQCKQLVKPEDSHNWIKKLISLTKPQQVIVLSSQSKSSFQGNLQLKNSGTDILRHLKSSWYDEKLSCNLLECGNIVSSLPAAVLAYCQMFNLPAALYVNFTESHFVDVFSLKAYQQVLNDKFLKDLPQVSKSIVSQRLKNFDGVGVADNNLYI